MARSRSPQGVLVIFALALATCAAAPAAFAEPPGGPAACRNYLTADQLTPRFDTPLPIPDNLKPYYKQHDGTPVWVLRAREYNWQPAPGVCIPKWGFEGTTPGPTLRVKPHQRSEVAVYNELPERLYNPFLDPYNPLTRTTPPSPIATKYTFFGPNPVLPPAPFDAEPFSRSQYELDPELTVHLHGGHQTPPYDGYPEDTFKPGRSHIYDYPNNQEATTLWYHDHTMDHTRGHVLMGLAGFYLVDDPKQSRLGLPTGDDQIPVMFQRVPAEMLDQPKVNQPIWAVNNTLAPYLQVTNKPYRFRFLNGNDESPLQIWTTTDPDDPHAVAPQAYLQQVGTDGGLMNKVATDRSGAANTRVRLFPAERADVVIDFSKVREPTTFYLQAKTLPAFVGDGNFGPDPSIESPQPIVQFRVTPTNPQPKAFGPPGGKLRPGKPIKRLRRKGAHERTFVFDFNNLGTPPFATVNGRFFDPMHSYAKPKLGATEVWHLINKTDGYHPIHIHDIFFQVISRHDTHHKPVEQQPGDWGSGNLAWKDVFVVPPFGSVTIIGRFTDNKGQYVFHCHNLIHEDAGMMAQFDVVKAGSKTAPATHNDHAAMG